MMPAGNVEVWLGEVERRMKASIRTQVSHDYEHYALIAALLGYHGHAKPQAAAIESARSCWFQESTFSLYWHSRTCCCVVCLFGQVVAAMHAYVTRPRTSWVREWPAMVVLAVSQIFWARGVEEAVAAGSVQVRGVANTTDYITSWLSF
jgi:hypothetical protein